MEEIHPPGEKPKVPSARAPPNRALPIMPPTSEPTMPRTAVMIQPIDCRPGKMARAMSPTMRPKIRKPMIPMCVDSFLESKFCEALPGG